MIQLDIVAECGLGMLSAYQVTGNTRWFDAAKHWADLLAEKRNRQPGAAPWGRYANPEAAPWKDDKQTGGVVFLLTFFDELIRLGYTGTDNRIVEARDAGRAYLRDDAVARLDGQRRLGAELLGLGRPGPGGERHRVRRPVHDGPQGRASPTGGTTPATSCRCSSTTRASAPESNGDVYSGAWAFPESSSCCGRSLWYGPMELAKPFAQYGVEADSAWARELARRMQILATYDAHETGVSEDNIDGGFIVCGDWFKIAHPMALRHVLGTMAWLPRGIRRRPRKPHSPRVVGRQLGRLRQGQGRLHDVRRSGRKRRRPAAGLPSRDGHGRRRAAVRPGRPESQRVHGQGVALRRLDRLDPPRRQEARHGRGQRPAGGGRRRRARLRGRLATVDRRGGSSAARPAWPAPTARP